MSTRLRVLFKVGDKVGVGCMVDSCRQCESCKDGDENYCATGAVMTYNGKFKYKHCQDRNAASLHGTSSVCCPCYLALLLHPCPDSLISFRSYDLSSVLPDALTGVHGGWWQADVRRLLSEHRRGRELRSSAVLCTPVPSRPL